MFCAYCKMTREENKAPCPYCGAPSPLLVSSQASAESWGAGGRGMPANSQPVWGTSASPQAAFPRDQSGGFSNSPIPPSWGQTGQDFQQQQQPARSMLPVPYQGGMFPQQIPEGLPGTMLQPLPYTQGQGQSLLPGLPDEEYGAIYVPPMYTKPRPIIPRYRIISGFLSVIIVTLMLCAGAGYYAKASGTTNTLGRMLGMKLPKSIQAAATPQLPDPPDKVDKGPAFAIIDSATTTSHIDPTTHSPRQTERVFQVNHPFYVTYSVQHPTTKGVVIIKWYTNNAFFKMAKSDSIDAGSMINGDSEMEFVAPAEGMVELYWNDQLAQRLYLVVR